MQLPSPGKPPAETFLLTLELAPGFILIGWQKRFPSERQQNWPAPVWTRVRFYQKLGLIKSPARSTGGYRLFEDQKIRGLTFVRHAQELGFSLHEIKELLALRQKQHACSEVQSMLKSKLTDVRAKIEGLVDLEADLRGALRNCNRELRLKPALEHEDCCPLLKRLGRINGSSGQRP